MKYVWTAVLLAGSLMAQWSGSGSNGSDGALDLGADTPGVANGVLEFDPVALGKDANSDNVYHFTTITIRDNLTVVFKANKMRRPGPVVFLATGAVNIGGRLVFSGEFGHPSTNNDSLRRISIPGPGGFPGGVAARTGVPATAGQGPGGGKVRSQAGPGCPGAYTNAVVPSYCSSLPAPPAYGSNLLQPLVGGSGGSGSATINGAGGGAGGGAIRISSSAHIVFGSGLGSGPAAENCRHAGYGSFHQYVMADGGSSENDGGGPGAGGAVHLQAPIVAGCGTHLYARPGSHVVSGVGNVYASEGRIRVDSNAPVNVAAEPLATVNSLVDVPLPPNPPFLRVVSINNVPVPASPRFDYASPDVLINSTSPVPVVIQGQNIPINTPVTLFFTTDTGADITTAANLTGTVANSTATVNVTLPLGTARLIARAIW
jgi:hypothetical protein